MGFSLRLATGKAHGIELKKGFFKKERVRMGEDGKPVKINGKVQTDTNWTNRSKLLAATAGLGVVGYGAYTWGKGNGKEEAAASTGTNYMA